MAENLGRIVQQLCLPTYIGAQPSKYQCDRNDKHDASGNHQNLEGVIAWNVIVCTLYALHGHDCTPCQQTPDYLFGFFIYVGMRAITFRIELFGQKFSGSLVTEPRPDGQSQGLRRDGFSGRQTSYDALHIPN